MQLDKLEVKWATSTVGRNLPITPKKGESILKWGRQIQKAKKNEGIRNMLKDDGGNMVDAKEVVEEFYGKLYAKKDTSEESKVKWVGKIKRSIHTQIAHKLENEISEEEIKEAVKELNGGKAPGSDRLGVELYKKIPLMRKWLAEAWKEANIKGRLWESARLSLIRLIYKKSDRERVTNYRPISLCNVDYKIIAKVIAMRLQEVLGEVIDEEQTGFIKERDIRINVAVARAFWKK